MIRPEMIDVRRTASDEVNVIPGRIDAATFLGSSYELNLILEGGEPLAVQLPAVLAGGDSWSAGQDVFIAIDPDTAIGIREMGNPPTDEDAFTGNRGRASAA
jgi:hypothetical protein